MGMAAGVFGFWAQDSGLERSWGGGGEEGRAGGRFPVPKDL